MIDLWIRSQSKMHLFKCNNIAVAQTTHNEAQVMGYVDSEFGYVELGKYKTLERATAILDNIQSKLNTFLLDFRHWNYANIVYEMPQE